MIELKENDLVFAKVRPDATIPSKNTEDAGYDIYANFEEDYFVIPSNETVLVPTGIASAMTDKYYLNVAERGSTGKIGMKYGAGIIDSSYRGEIFICLNNVSSKDIVISKLTTEELIEKHGVKEDEFVLLSYNTNGHSGNVVLDNPSFTLVYPYSKAIAQLIVHEVPKMDVKEISYDELKQIPSKRGTGSLGSSGK